MIHREQDIRVRELQHDLTLLAMLDERYAAPTTDGVYGEETAHAVRLFQQANGLPATGQMDEETGRALTAAYEDLLHLLAPPHTISPFPSAESVLVPGDSGGCIAILQVILNEIGKPYRNLPQIPITGNFDLPTREVVVRWQHINEFPEDGRVDRFFWDRLANLYNTAM